jgi:hypothetical protein
MKGYPRVKDSVKLVTKSDPGKVRQVLDVSIKE